MILIIKIKWRATRSQRKNSATALETITISNNEPTTEAKDSKNVMGITSSAEAISSTSPLLIPTPELVRIIHRAVIKRDIQYAKTLKLYKFLTKTLLTNLKEKMKLIEVKKMQRVRGTLTSKKLME